LTYYKNERIHGEHCDMPQEKQTKPVIGITIGDFNGIGPEIIIKTLMDNRICKFCTPVVFGSSKIFSRYKKILQIEGFQYQSLGENTPLNPKKANIMNCWEDNLDIKPGKVRQEAGRSAFLALQKSVEFLKSGQIEAVVTAPINKDNIQSPEFQYPGHTEFYTESFTKNVESLMLLVSDDLRVGTVTGHIPLRNIAESLTKEKIRQKLVILINTLKKDFGIQRPKVAVLGLNPHAGENGLLGKEEQDIIEPVLTELKKKGNLVFGPFPSDGFFGTASYQKYDAVLAMYHDQGLIPFKTLAFDTGVNFTAGLPIIRTSPDHGTAYGIAGRKKADESSFRAALFLACDIVKSRQEYQQLQKVEISTS